MCAHLTPTWRQRCGFPNTLRSSKTFQTNIKLEKTEVTKTLQIIGETFKSIQRKVMLKRREKEEW
uniref:Putative ovule protein n=1 Tax=Solanum chacoense TaxID=4108 RepID=A0A0V0GI04_SOLCH